MPQQKVKQEDLLVHPPHSAWISAFQHAHIFCLGDAWLQAWAVTVGAIPGNVSRLFCVCSPYILLFHTCYLALHFQLSSFVKNMETSAQPQSHLRKQQVDIFISNHSPVIHHCSKEIISLTGKTIIEPWCWFMWSSFLSCVIVIRLNLFYMNLSTNKGTLIRPAHTLDMLKDGSLTKASRTFLWLSAHQSIWSFIASKMNSSVKWPWVSQDLMRGWLKNQWL